MADAKLNVKFTVRDEGAPVIERVRRNFRRMADDGARAGKDVSSAWKTALGVFAGVGAVNIASAALRVLRDLTIGLVMDTAKLAEVQETAERRMEAVLRATGGAVGYTADQLKRMAAEFQDVLGIGDEEILRLQTVMLTFRNVTGEVFREAIELTADMAFVMGTDARSAAIQLGKALNDPIQGVSALRRVGVSFTEQQKEQIRALQESGDLMGAQKIVLAELRQEFGGVSREMDGTWKRATENLSHAWGDFKEQLGAFVTEDRSVIGFLEDLTGVVKKLAEQAERFRKFMWGPKGAETLAHERTMLEWQLGMAATPEMRQAIQRRLDVLAASERGAEAYPDPWVEAARRHAKAVRITQNILRNAEQDRQAKAKAVTDPYAEGLRRLKEVTTADLIVLQRLEEKRHQEHLDRLLHMDKSYSEKLRRLKEITTADLIAIQEAQATAAARPAGSQEDIVRALTDNATTNPLRRLKEVSEQDWKVIREVQDRFKKDLEDTGSTAQDAARQIQMGFGSAFARALVYGEKFSDSMKGLFSDLASYVTSVFARATVGSVFGLFGLDLGFSLGSIFKFHDGGEIPALPRAHTGLNLAPDEVPIIAQTGERVLSRDQNRDFTDFLRREREERSRPAVVELVLDGRTLAQALVDLAEDGRFPVVLRA